MLLEHATRGVVKLLFPTGTEKPVNGGSTVGAGFGDGVRRSGSRDLTVQQWVPYSRSDLTFQVR